MKYETEAIKIRNEINENYSELEEQIVTKSFQIIANEMINQEEETNFEKK